MQALARSSGGRSHQRRVPGRSVPGIACAQCFTMFQRRTIRERYEPNERGRVEAFGRRCSPSRNTCGMSDSARYGETSTAGADRTVGILWETQIAHQAAGVHQIVQSPGFRPGWATWAYREYLHRCSWRCAPHIGSAAHHRESRDESIAEGLRVPSPCLRSGLGLGRFSFIKRGRMRFLHPMVDGALALVLGTHRAWCLNGLALRRLSGERLRARPQFR